MKNTVLEIDLLAHEIIAPFSEINKRRPDEKLQIGRFLAALILKKNINIKLLDFPKSPKPDCIIEINNKIIGLEHTRIDIDFKAEANIIIKKLLVKAEKNYIEKFGNVGFMIFIKVKPNVRFPKKKEPEIISSLIDLVHNYQQNSIPIVNNNSHFIVTKSMPNSIPLVQTVFQFEQGITIQHINRKAIVKSIKRKEVPGKYNLSGLDEFWLLLVETSIYSSHPIESANNLKNEKSVFNYIYSFNYKTCELLQLENS